MADEATPGAAVVDLLKGEIDIGLGFIEALDRKLALIPPLLGTVAALLLPESIAASQATFVILAAVATFGAVLLALIGLLGMGVEIGPDHEWLAGQTAADPPAFHAEVADRQRMCVESLTRASKRKARLLNAALAFASTALLLFLVARLIPGG